MVQPPEIGSDPFIYTFPNQKGRFSAPPFVTQFLDTPLCDYCSSGPTICLSSFSKQLDLLCVAHPMVALVNADLQAVFSRCLILVSNYV